MRTGAIPFQFDIGRVTAALVRTANPRLDALTLLLPFGQLLVHPNDRERQIAVETVTRLRDRRVLSAQECCDGCIDRALGSLQTMRAALVEAQVALGGDEAGPLFQLTELMLVAIRQFLTFEERLRDGAPQPRGPGDEFYRRPEQRQTYFDAIEMLRGHLSRSLAQIAVVGGMAVPADGLVPGYQGPWTAAAYSSTSDRPPSDIGHGAGR